MNALVNAMEGRQSLHTFAPKTCLIGIDREAGTYSETDQGEPGWSLPVYDRFYRLESYVAWRREKPETWFGMGGLPHPVLLGAANLLWAELTHGVVHLVLTPEAFVADQERSICILDWRSNIESILPGGLCVVADEKVQRSFRQHWCRSAWENAGFEMVTSE